MPRNDRKGPGAQREKVKKAETNEGVSFRIIAAIQELEKSNYPPGLKVG